ncbi:MAG TPA: hypothetical protein VGI92_01245 [Gemmatimonadales bacterium]|jgi:hypothetical protein
MAIRIGDEAPDFTGRVHGGPASVSDDDAKKKYPQGFKTHKPYLRTVTQPK